MCAALQSIDFDKRFHGSGGYGIFRRGKIVTVHNQRCLSSNPSVGNGRFMKRPYEQNRCLCFYRRGDSRIARSAVTKNAKVGCTANGNDNPL